MTTKQFETPITGIAHPLAERAWGSHLLWVPAAALLGFAIAAIFAGLLHLPRNIYLIPYVALVSLFFYAFMRWSGLSTINLLRHNWVWGVIVAVLLGMFTVNNILSQPASTRSEGLSLAFNILWVGVVYGLVDALLLSVLPVLATWGAFSALGWTAHWWGKIPVGFIAILLGLFVTISYHLGYPECRVAGGLFGPTLGNGAMTLGYVLTNNPISAIFSHIAMHVAGVLQGPESVIQLPPHY
jgi:hypothetical protein